MVGATALSPLGFPRPYAFGGESLVEWDGARVWVHFDPFEAPVRAAVTLAEPYRDTPAGTILARGLPCLNAAAEVLRDEAGAWQVRWADGLAEAAAAKRLANSAVRRELRALGLDGKRVAAESEVSAPGVGNRVAGIGTTERPPEVDAFREARRTEVDVAELERFEAEEAGLQLAAG